MTCGSCPVVARCMGVSAKVAAIGCVALPRLCTTFPVGEGTYEARTSIRRHISAVPRHGPPCEKTTMALTELHGVTHASADPFAEVIEHRFTFSQQILGARFRFEGNDQALVDVAQATYAGLPRHRLPIAAPEFRIELRLLPRRPGATSVEPPPARVQSGAGLLCSVMDASNYVVLAPGQRRALVVVSADMLDEPYHVRYELIEFAVFVLATRGLGLVPLHGACVGRGGRGVLVLGASGAGKSTLALHSLLRGLDFLAEDAVFVRPESLLATGVPNFLHVRADALGFIDDDVTRRWIGQSPMIRRRSGVEKFEADLRLGQFKMAEQPMELTAAVFVSSEPASGARLVNRLTVSDATSRLLAEQPYACTQPGWRCFEERLTRRGVHELKRGRHPGDSVDALLTLLA